MKTTSNRTPLLGYFSIPKISIVITFLLVLATQKADAQTGKERAIEVSVGYGLTAAYDDVEADGSGLYVQGEYVFGLSRWFQLRPYAGYIITGADEDDTSSNDPDLRATTNAFLVGGKGRVTAPIPWVAPYLEAGIGVSFGSFETSTASIDIEKSGVLLHIPFSIGLELGRKRNFDIAFTYYFHPSAEQFAGAFAFGVSFPIDRN
ncbi:outer membrane beta-barrel protein [Ascidiimonas aurantiaca]|uniref:outer membrane beta-barrel protein n=1 Tax=Ascidiimonas aurantiaca TaxID=1685432 RepID=UPI0030ED646F